MAEVVGIRFKTAGKIYYFDTSGISLEIDDCVIVETARGLELGNVVTLPKQMLDGELNKTLKPVVRKADTEDIKQAQEFAEKEKEAMMECAKLITKLNLTMKLLSAKYNLDGSRLTFFFSAVERVDFRELVRQLSKLFKIRVELRQVGSRDESKLIGGFGRCGRPLCCMSFLSEFTPVSIKMAKEQDLSLNPMRISGVCGRLLCCLGYESEQYRTIKKKMPKVGKQVSVPDGVATVIESNSLKETVLVELKNGTRVELPITDLTVIEE
ncbi:MAG: stage 0 sporulation family protein [Dehalococcoidales bacterium]|nr:stage 0 sporulation family protein [Dehalococcoidales bacterium]